MDDFQATVSARGEEHGWLSDSDGAHHSYASTKQVSWDQTCIRSSVTHTHQVIKGRLRQGCNGTGGGLTSKLFSLNISLRRIANFP